MPNREILVLWPSTNAAGERPVNTLEMTLRTREAIGYATSPDRVRLCKFLIFTSGNERPRKHFIAQIRKVSRNERLGRERLDSGRRPYPCSDITFSDPQDLPSGACSRIDTHRWGSKNVLYIKESDVDPKHLT